MTDWKCTDKQTRETKVLSESEAFDLDTRLWDISPMGLRVPVQVMVIKSTQCDRYGYETWAPVTGEHMHLDITLTDLVGVIVEQITI